MVSAGLSSVNENDQKIRKKGGLLLAFLENLSGYSSPPIGKTDLLTRLVAYLFGSLIDGNFFTPLSPYHIFSGVPSYFASLSFPIPLPPD